ncbi:MAG TPA: D-alanyl-D-alanine carboxypeptidase [Aliidongia sp.]|uniref:D-alanyl-D-alanine carboxypeptidase n=1 Tax=Aliidongia sp. TaxID=1914230 RepID=UPI002DDCEE80|nr:D-alanyl-D-alanine carboxypeptidase [Aliidongia sp.]HEV2676720.1 D-alanyl-D-alanine carboxypeptidase [Aliidongia sp.]
MTCLAGGSTSAWAGYASMVIDSTTGEVLNEVNADELNHPASLTKMMTLYMTFEALQRGKITLDTRMPVSEFAAAKMPTHLGVPAGDMVSVKECVLGMVVLSANDCAAIAGEYLAGGSETAFARMMTDKAHALGMTNTTFRNASGLPDDEQVTSARDLVKLAQHLHDDFPQYYRFFATREFIFRGRVIKGHNHLMYRYAGMDGLKTGFTSASGFNLASSAERDGHRLIGVVMGSTSGGVRDNLMATLLDNGFAHRQTDPMLVAEAGGQSARTAKRLFAGAGSVLAALSPIPKAEAATPAATQAPASARILRAHAAKPGGIVTAVSSERWAVQVGAFSSHSQAEEAADHAIRLAGVRGQTSILAPERNEKHKIYRARLNGFSTERQARDACGALHKKGHLCVVVPPGKGSVKLARN